MVSNDEKHSTWLFIYLAVITVVTRTSKTDTHHETNHEGDQYNDDQCLVVDEHLNLL